MLATATLGACSSSGGDDAAGEAPFGPCGSTLAALTAAAKDEGALTLIGSPRAWANSGEIIDAFAEKFGIDVTSIYPDATSGEELTVLRTWRTSPQRPDVVDLTPSVAQEAVSEGLLQPYKSTLWPTIPAQFKEPSGAWVETYLGTMTFGVNKDKVTVIPRSWNDLQRPEYRGQVTLSGDPRESGTAMSSVIGAALAQGGSFDDVMPGIRYFAHLNKIGNLNSIAYTDANLLYGDVPIGLDWNFSFAESDRNLTERGIDFAVIEPTDGQVALPYAQAISASAPHPCAARLWMEYLSSNDAATSRLAVNAVPTRFESLPPSVQPTAAGSLIIRSLANGSIMIPTPQQLASIQATIDSAWGSMVLGTTETPS